MNTKLIACLCFTIMPLLVSAQFRSKNKKDIRKAESTISIFEKKDVKFSEFLEEAYAYVVFPSVGKGAIGVGGAHGGGTAFEQGNPVGKARITQLTIGFQLGGQSYRQIIFFETKADFQRFKDNKIEFAAQASAVAADEGVSGNIPYREGVAVFTLTKGGLMYEAALGGQRLSFKPY